jgi:hypothetical protein
VEVVSGKDGGKGRRLSSYNYRLGPGRDYHPHQFLD